MGGRGIAGQFQLFNDCSSSCLTKVTVGFDPSIANSRVLAFEGTRCRIVGLCPKSS
jgi:hypothetical protein